MPATSLASGAGANTVTVTFNQAVPYADLRILEYSGLATTRPAGHQRLRRGHERHGQQRLPHHQRHHELLVAGGHDHWRV